VPFVNSIKHTFYAVNLTKYWLGDFFYTNPVTLFPMSYGPEMVEAIYVP
jgi:hypothetical protein